MNTSSVLLLLTLILSACHGEEQKASNAPSILATTEAQKLETPLEASCPDPTDIEPCVCSNDGELTMECESIQDEYQLWNVFSAYFPNTAFKRLFIRSGEGLKVLENGVFHNVSFQLISIDNCGLQVVEDQALDPSLSTLVVLVILNCQLATFPFQRLPEMTSLDTMSLYNNTIASIPPLSSSALKVLVLDANPISSLSTDVFKGLTAVHEISLHHCQLTEITPGTFIDIPNLNQIILNNNNLTYIQSFTFQNVYAPLYEGGIRLINNNIDFVEVDAFEGVQEKSQIILNGNALTRLPEREWRPVLEKEITVFLEANPLICGCDVAWLVRDPQLLARVVLARCPDGRDLTDLDPADFITCG